MPFFRVFFSTHSTIHIVLKDASGVKLPISPTPEFKGDLGENFPYTFHHHVFGGKPLLNPVEFAPVPQT